MHFIIDIWSHFLPGDSALYVQIEAIVEAET